MCIKPFWDLVQQALYMHFLQQYWLACCLFLSFIFTVFEILLGFLKHKNWELAFYEVIPQRKIEPSNTYQDLLTDPDRKIEPSNIYQELLTDPDRKIEPNSTHQDLVTDPDSSPRTQVQLQDEATGDEEEETGPCPPADCKERSSD